MNRGEIEFDAVGLTITEIQGTADEVIRDKIERASSQVEGVIMVEDSSLFFTAWGSLPGPYM